MARAAAIARMVTRVTLRSGMLMILSRAFLARAAVPPTMGIWGFCISDGAGACAFSRAFLFGGVGVPSRGVGGGVGMAGSVGGGGTGVGVGLGVGSGVGGVG